MRAVGMRSLVLGTASAAMLALARRSYLHWGSTEAELATALPGDELVPNANVTATRAATIAAAPDAVWPWIAQLGQGRGGFYTYDFLEKDRKSTRLNSSHRALSRMPSSA